MIAMKKRQFQYNIENRSINASFMYMIHGTSKTNLVPCLDIKVAINSRGIKVN